MTGNYVFETGSMTGILGQLKWERRKDSRLILLYKGLKDKARILTDDLIPKNKHCRNQHSLAFQIPSASKETYKSIVFPLATFTMAPRHALSPEPCLFLNLHSMPYILVKSLSKSDKK